MSKGEDAEPVRHGLGPVPCSYYYVLPRRGERVCAGTQRWEHEQRFEAEVSRI